jgi:hypothetical protein
LLHATSSSAQPPIPIHTTDTLLHAHPHNALLWHPPQTPLLSVVSTVDVTHENATHYARLCVAHVGLDCASPTFGLDFASSRSLRLSVDFVTTLTIRSPSSFPLRLYPFWHYAAYFITWHYCRLSISLALCSLLFIMGYYATPSSHHGHYVALFSISGTMQPIINLFVCFGYYVTQ